MTLSCAPHKPEPRSISLGMRILGTPPSVYCASTVPLEPTAHCLHVRILVNALDDAYGVLTAICVLFLGGDPILVTTEITGPFIMASP